MRFEGVLHVALIVSSYEVSKHFYVNILGLPIIGEHYRQERNSYKLDLDAGNILLELFSFPNAPKRVSFPEACGLRHLCFASQNIEEDKKQLEESGIVVEPIRIDPYTQRKYTFFFDPDKLPIEIYEK